jgi:hypothetical protein
MRVFPPGGCGVTPCHAGWPGRRVGPRSPVRPPGERLNGRGGWRRQAVPAALDRTIQEERVSGAGYEDAR